MLCKRVFFEQVRLKELKIDALHEGTVRVCCASRTNLPGKGLSWSEMGLGSITGSGDGGRTLLRVVREECRDTGYNAGIVWN